MKITLWVAGSVFSFVVLFHVVVWWQDNYSLLHKTVSPNGERVAVLIGNHGGGGPGYCRDLVYDFPNNKKLPSITSAWAEARNKDYLVKVANCDAIKKLEWKNNELVWLGKGTIPDY